MLIEIEPEASRKNKLKQICAFPEGKALTGIHPSPGDAATYDGLLAAAAEACRQVQDGESAGKTSVDADIPQRNGDDNQIILRQYINNDGGVMTMQLVTSGVYRNSVHKKTWAYITKAYITKRQRSAAALMKEDLAGFEYPITIEIVRL